MVWAICIAILLAGTGLADPTQVSGTVTNGTVTWTVTSQYSLGFLEQIEIKYNSAVTETITVQVVKGSVTNTFLSQALSSNASFLWRPNADINLGPVNTIWRISAPSSGSVPANVYMIVNDLK